MSIEVLTWVFKHSEAKLANRLVLLALADYAHDDGSKAFPSIPKLAAKARVSERTAIRCLQALAKAGAIEQTGKTRGGTKIYKVLMGANLAHDNLSRDIDGDSGVTSTAARGDIDGSAPYREPSIDQSEESSPSRSKAPLSHLLAELLKANGVPPKKCVVTATWATAERRMVEIDKRPPGEAEELLRWATREPFWQSVILSMNNFRKHYDAIRLQRSRRGSGARGSTDSDMADLDQLQREAEEREGL